MCRVEPHSRIDLSFRYPSPSFQWRRESSSICDHHSGFPRDGCIEIHSSLGTNRICSKIIWQHLQCGNLFQSVRLSYIGSRPLYTKYPWTQNPSLLSVSVELDSLYVSATPLLQPSSPPPHGDASKSLLPGPLSWKVVGKPS